MGTDTAFALGVLALVGGRWAPSIRTFLLTLVIVDDVAALTVVALAYTKELSGEALLVALALFGVVLIMRRARVGHGVAYFLVGFALWVAMIASGVHATIAGIALGVLATAHPPARRDLERAGALWRLFREEPTPEYGRSASRGVALAISPSERLQHLFTPWTSHLIVPLFALTNAGVELNGDVLRHASTSPVTLGVVFGLVGGKLVGITVATWLFTRRRLGGLRLTLPWPPLVGAATVAGIGFTVALLIADITFDGDDLEDAKLGILAASVLASFLAWIVFRALERMPRRLAFAGGGGVAPRLVDLVEAVDPEVDHVRGPGDGPVTLLEYGDFECPNCGQAAGTSTPPPTPTQTLLATLATTGRQWRSERADSRESAPVRAATNRHRLGDRFHISHEEATRSPVAATRLRRFPPLVGSPSSSSMVDGAVPARSHSIAVRKFRRYVEGVADRGYGALLRGQGHRH